MEQIRMKYFLLLFLTVIFILSCKKNNSNIIDEQVEVRNNMVDGDEETKIHYKAYLGSWKLDKIRLAWLNKDSIIQKNYYLHLEKKRLKYFNEYKLLFESPINIIKNNESEIGSYLLNSNDEMFYSFNFLNDSLFVFKNAYDSDILIYKRVIVSDSR